MVTFGIQGCAHAPDSGALPPSDASIHELIETTGFDQIETRLVRRGADVMLEKYDTLIAKKKLNPTQTEIFREGTKDMVAVFEEEMSWKNLEPDFADCFKEFYSQREVDALIRFYRSPPGTRLLSRAPSALLVFNRKNLDEWVKIRQSQGDEAYYERMSHDLEASLGRKDIDGLVAFYDSDVGREIGIAADQAQVKFHDVFSARMFAALERIKPMSAALNARINAAK